MANGDKNRGSSTFPLEITLFKTLKVIKPIKLCFSYLFAFLLVSNIRT